MKRVTSRESNLAYVGTYTHGESLGIYVCQLEMSTGELKKIGIAENVDNPSYLALDPQNDRLYAVNELMEFDGLASGAVSAFAIDGSSGELTFISQTASHGRAPCYLTIDKTGRFLLVVNYMGGNIVVIPVEERGELGMAKHIENHAGSGKHPDRQEEPHPHSIVVDSSNKFVLVSDLGLDKVMQYCFDGESGGLSPSQQPWIEVEPGSGPRHIVFHPNDRFAYIINELRSTITACHYDSMRGTLELFQTVSTIPEGYAGSNTAADLHLTPDGTYLYGSNRGHDSIICYRINQKTGWLTAVDIVSTQGKTPRGFAIDPTGTYLLAANQNSDSIITFQIDKGEGKLLLTENRLDIPSPVCIKMMSSAIK